MMGIDVLVWTQVSRQYVYCQCLCLCLDAGYCLCLVLELRNYDSLNTASVSNGPCNVYKIISAVKHSTFSSRVLVLVLASAISQLVCLHRRSLLDSFDN